jgi:hypothetical protein
MSKLRKLIQQYNGGTEALNNILKEALLIDREVLNLQVALRLACGPLSDWGENPQGTMDYYLEQAVEQVNKDTCPICQEYMEQTSCIQFVAGQAYHQACWLSRDKPTEL